MWCQRRHGLAQEIRPANGDEINRYLKSFLVNRQQGAVRTTGVVVVVVVSGARLPSVGDVSEAEGSVENISEERVVQLCVTCCYLSRDCPRFESLLIGGNLKVSGLRVICVSLLLFFPYFARFLCCDWLVCSVCVYIFFTGNANSDFSFLTK